MISKDLVAGYELLLKQQKELIAKQEQQLANMKQFIIKQYGYLPTHLQERRQLSQEEISAMLKRIDEEYDNHLTHWELS